MVALMGTPFSPWHELHTCNFASTASAAFAGTAARASKSDKSAENSRKVIADHVSCRHCSSARGAAIGLKHAAVRLVTQDGRHTGAKVPARNCERFISLRGMRDRHLIDGERMPGALPRRAHRRD